MKVVPLPEFDVWFSGLSKAEQKSVAKVIEMLAAMGLMLNHPHSTAINGTDLPLRELRPTKGASPLRVFYAFDPARDAVLLVGGDKGKDKKMYERLIPIAEALWKKHIGS